MLHQGDLFDVLPTLPEASVDACVTDPPYGIGFMGRKWDTFRPGVEAARIVENTQIDSDNPNLRGRTRGPASSPSAVEYDYTIAGLRQFQDWSERWAREVFRVLKPGAYIVVCGAPRSYHRMACGLEDAGFVIRDKFAWLFGSGFPKNHDLGNGKGTALKPAHEPIALAWKPFKGTIQNCHQQYGTAALNIDACRIDGDKWTRSTPHKDDIRGGAMHAAKESKTYEVGPQSGNELGRWPANVVIDEEAAAAIDEHTGVLQSGFMRAGTEREGIGYHGGLGNTVRNDTIGDIGGASRFYYCAKPSREERDLGCHELKARPRDDSRKDGNPGGDNPRNRGLQRRGNFHPTVKPIDLMRWLVRLVTPAGGTVLDPFTGSGTTGCACAYEGVNFIGIEREADYIAIADRRIAACAPLLQTAMLQ